MLHVSVSATCTRTAYIPSPESVKTNDAQLKITCSMFTQFNNLCVCVGMNDAHLKI